MAPPKSSKGQIKPKSRKNASSPTSTAQPDARFAAIGTDPRYRLPSAKHSRVNVDSRFSRMFNDDEFSSKAAVDRYGRVLSKGSGKRDLEKFYRVEDEGKKSGGKSGKKEVEVVGSSDESEEDVEELGSEEDEDEEEEEEEEDDDDEDDDNDTELERVEKKNVKTARDYAREGGFSDSSSDEEDSEDGQDAADSDDDDVEIVNYADEEEAPEVPMGEVSHRLAVVNLDWDNIRAADLMAVAQSFVPLGGKNVRRVVVYPSEFGRERMQREELEGPPRDIFASSSSKRNQDLASDEEEDSEDEEERIRKELLTEDTGEEFDSGKLRQYQLDRLKYYYAVITCDTKETAKTLYDDMDGREYLTTANFFDLRFIPDEVSFDDDIPRDECTKLPPSYKPNDFVTDALTHSKVRLTWDADDTTRKEVQKRAFSRAEIDENDMQAYIGSDSSDDEEDGAIGGETDAPKLSKAEQQRQKMRAALGLTTAPAKSSKKNKDSSKPAVPVGEMQITFSSGLTGPAGKKESTSVFENTPEEANETTREKYIRKEKERKQRRKEKSKAIQAGMDPAVAAAAAEAEEAAEAEREQDKQDQDLGFDDPFFNDAVAAQKAEKEIRKAEKAKKRAEREEADKLTAEQRAELELLMVDDKADNAMRHFDMNEIAKAEKLAKKKGKKGKKGKEAEQKVDGADFQIQTQDPRFSSLFESHEFAIDPTNPRFQNTSGMKALLEEGRKKRKGWDDGAEEDGEVKRVKKSKKSKLAAGAEEGDEAPQGEDLQKLLARVKAKTGKK